MWIDNFIFIILIVLIIFVIVLGICGYYCTYVPTLEGNRDDKQYRSIETVSTESRFSEECVQEHANIFNTRC